ncbi:MAG: thioesterase family protein [Hyphomicrobiaceae bacterium]
MENWTETYRGTVSAWECDIVEHFTIAYYFEKFADATRNFVELLGVADNLLPSVGAAGSRVHVAFQHELRAGSAFHIVSAIVALDADRMQLGHQLIDSAAGRTVSWVSETLPLPKALTQAERTRLAGLAVAWPGPEVPQPLTTLPQLGALTCRERVKPSEIDEAGYLSASDHVHRFSGAGMHFLTSIGMNGTYMSENRRGFSTFMLDFVVTDRARPGERTDVHTAPARLGNTSMAYLHRMLAADGRPLASMLQSGVHLDLDVRRPTPLPDQVRANIEAILGK